MSKARITMVDVYEDPLYSLKSYTVWYASGRLRRYTSRNVPENVVRFTRLTAVDHTHSTALGGTVTTYGRIRLP